MQIIKNCFVAIPSLLSQSRDIHTTLRASFHSPFFGVANLQYQRY